jgi:glycosyltransferase involved in cell wall biosynthesis
MLIGIDARFLTHPQVGGFKTYTTSLISALAVVDQANRYVLFVDREPGEQLSFPVAAPNFETRVVTGRLPLLGMPLREQWGLARQVSQDQLDLFHAPCLTAPLSLRCPLVVTVHDMIWHNPRLYSAGRPRSASRWLMEWYYRLTPRLAAQRAALVLTVSQAARATIQATLGLDPARLRVTYEAADPVYRRLSDPLEARRVREKFGLAREYLLAIGSADPRKNLGVVLQAYARLPVELRQCYQLAIVWTHSFLAEYVADQVRALNLEQSVVFMRQVSQADLLRLYNGAAVFVFPSQYEGFGLPLLEAMACGAPVIAANNSSIPEVAGQAARLTATEDVASWSSTIGEVLENPTLRADLSQRGLRRAAEFSWERCARETVAAYEQALVQP